MNILYLLMALAIVFILMFVGFYIWAVRKGQFDDLETPAHRILIDEDTKIKENGK